MLENAGRYLAQLARQSFLNGDPRGARIILLAGTGGNGGGGLVCARRLGNWGAHVQVYLTAPVERMAEVPRHQYAIIEQMGVPVEVASSEVTLAPGALVVNALIGYSLRGAPSGATAALIHAANRHGAPILSLDISSGLDATTGQVHDPAISAAATLTLALPKTGLCVSEAKASVGELYAATYSSPTVAVR